MQSAKSAAVRNFIGGRSPGLEQRRKSISRSRGVMTVPLAILVARLQRHGGRLLCFLSNDMDPLDRRRHDRSSLNARPTLERALETWLKLRSAWSAVFEGARAAKSWERMALAEAKIEQCEVEVARLEGLLREAHTSQ